MEWLGTVMAAIVGGFDGGPARGPRLWWRRALLCGVLATLAGCAWIDAKQRELVYRPTPGRPAEFQGLRPNDVAFAIEVPAEGTGRSAPSTAPADRLQLWWLPNPDPQAPTLLYLHGTFRNLYQNIRKVDALRDAGFAVLAVEYRGWGESSPILPSEHSIDADARAAWTELVRRQPDPRKRVIFGHSMGTGAAVELASHLHGGTDYGGLILEASFTRFPDIAKANGVVGTIASWFATQHFDSIDKIGKIDVPILMMHGSADHTVPIGLGRRLFEAAPKGAATWIAFDGGSHSGLDREAPQQYREAVHGLIERLGGDRASMPSPGRARAGGGDAP